MTDLDTLVSKARADIAAAADLSALDELRVGLLGKKGEISLLMKTLGEMSPEDRKSFGQKINVVRDDAAAALEARKSVLEEAALEARLASEKIDVTLTTRPESEGRIHPISQTIDEIVAIFGNMGFAVAEGPDIEDDFHNFTALNFPPDHPARQMHDTFFLPEKPDGSRMMLRTHTSTVQIRTMVSQKPPIRVIVP